MNILHRIRRYSDDADPLVAGCNWIALLLASNHPFYPFYLLWVVGGDWWTGCWTFLATPFFLAVPAVARRNSLLGRTMLPAVGIANCAMNIKVFGAPSGIALFLIPCALVALLGFRRPEWWTTMALLLATVAAWALNGREGQPIGRFDPESYDHFFQLNVYSVAVLSALILWRFIPARRAVAPL